MSTEELKALIYQRVDAFEDVMVLEAIADILNDPKQAEPKLAQWQKDWMEEGMRQYKAGNYYTREEVISRA